MNLPSPGPQISSGSRSVKTKPSRTTVSPPGWPVAAGTWGIKGRGVESPFSPHGSTCPAGPPAAPESNLCPQAHIQFLGIGVPDLASLGPAAIITLKMRQFRVAAPEREQRRYAGARQLFSPIARAHPRGRDPQNAMWRIPMASTLDEAGR